MPCLNETVFKQFKTKLSSLNICFFNDMKNTPPPMPSLKNLDLGGWGSNSGRYAALRWWKDLRQFPLDRLRITDHQLLDKIQLPITITSLSLQECPGFTKELNLAFHLPNLLYLDISLRMRNVQDALSKIDALFQLDIVSTKLRSFRMCRERHDLNLFQNHSEFMSKIAESCRELCSVQLSIECGDSPLLECSLAEDNRNTRVSHPDRVY